MHYTRLTVTCQPDFTEILIAELEEAGFDTFMETDHGLEAYVEGEGFDKTKLEEIKGQYGEAQVTYHFDRVEKKNWNEEWEKNYQPIVVDEKCLIRAHFHQPDRQYPYEIVITPKMSFGTGHHETTGLMVKAQMEIDHHDKMVMDAGCGTAVLAIMASKLGARQVAAFDIDEWSILNGKENVDVNGCANIHLRQGSIRDLAFDDPFDIILANINKNVLLDEMPQYKAHLNPGGLLLLSGFYDHDVADLLQRAALYNLREIKRDTLNAWAFLLLGS